MTPPGCFLSAYVKRNVLLPRLLSALCHWNSLLDCCASRAVWKHTVQNYTCFIRPTLWPILVFVLSGLRGKLQEANGAFCLTVKGIWVSKPVGAWKIWVLENEGQGECWFPDKQSDATVQWRLRNKSRSRHLLFSKIIFPLYLICHAVLYHNSL